MPIGSGGRSALRFLLLPLALTTAGITPPLHARTPSGAYSPTKGDPERKMILDTVRPAAEAELGSPVEFIVSEVNIAGDWAFAALQAQRPGGGAIDPRHTPFARRNGEEALEMFDCCHVEAVLQRSQGKWQLREAGVGSTDVWYMDWCKRTPRHLIGICASLEE